MQFNLFSSSLPLSEDTCIILEGGHWTIKGIWGFEAKLFEDKYLSKSLGNEQTNRLRLNLFAGKLYI